MTPTAQPNGGNAQQLLPRHVTYVQRMQAIRDELALRPGRAAAGARVRVSAPLARTCYLAYTRLAGPREDVLDYAAYLLAADQAERQPALGPLDLEAVESEGGGELTLLLSRMLYTAETQ
jgi:hypothetical protein